ncbi:protease [Lithospermum erythrorhizon]|uniref:Glutathione hydrolase n=1 Tax=Lithospermum erythrorhizon TaxID=34254 RepID=A0AAV3R2Z0_LITER
MGKQSFEDSLLGRETHVTIKFNKRWAMFVIFVLIVAITCLYSQGTTWFLIGENENRHEKGTQNEISHTIQSEEAVVAADDARCSEIGISMLKQGGHAVDAAVATAACLGVVHQMSSGIGGGGFMVVRNADAPPSEALAYDFRETAPLASSVNMYANGAGNKYSGALSMGVPGEVAGLHLAWSKHGRLPWKTLFQPAIELAREGFEIYPYIASSIASNADKIKSDPGLSKVYAPEGNLLTAGDTCYNKELGQSLEAVAEQGPAAFYNGTVGERLVADVKKAGGILTMEDLKNYRVELTKAVVVNAMGYTILGMPSPSSGTLGLSLVLNIVESYGTHDAASGPLGLHRVIEALKHMFAIRMDLGDPKFVNISKTAADMLSPSFAKLIQQKIFDNTTFPPGYYMPRWSQLRDSGTSHFCVVDKDRNAVALTTTVNYAFGGGILSPSTGIVLNDEMGDFSAPTEIEPDQLPPAPANFIEPKKRPLSSMTPIIVLKDNQLAGVIGGSGGMNIIPAVTQVFLNHFVLGMEPLASVQRARIYHKLIPNVVSYENWTVYDGEHIELSGETRKFLEHRGHKLESKSSGAIIQLVVQTLQPPANSSASGAGPDSNNRRGMLTAVCDPRKDGIPAAM